MYCERCGKEIEDNIRFCPHCGTSTMKGVHNESVSKVETRQNKNNRDVIAFVLGIITLALGVLPTYFTVIFAFALIATGIISICFGAFEFKKSIFAKLGMIFGIIGLVVVIIYCIYMIIVNGSGIFIF